MVLLESRDSGIRNLQVELRFKICKLRELLQFLDMYIFKFNDGLNKIQFGQIKRALK